MKYIKMFEIYNANFKKDFDDMSIDELLTIGAEKGWFSKKQCTIRDGDIVDVDGDVDMNRFVLTEIPIKFGRVSGNFKIDQNNLTDLKGSPSYVGGSFDCSNNGLVTLDGGPSYVGGKYDCSNNLLSTLVGIPDTMKVFKCTNNRLTNTIGFPKSVIWFEFWDNIYPNVDYLNTTATNFKIILKYQDEYGIWNSDGTLNKDRYDILVSEHQNKIID